MIPRVGSREERAVRRHLEAGLVGLIALACIAFTVVVVRGPHGEERNMRRTWRGWASGSGGPGDQVRALGRDEVLRLPGSRDGSWIRVESGTVVVTREGDPEDHVLEAGAELRVPGRGLAVAWALAPSRVEVRAARSARAAEQPPVTRGLSIAR